MGTLNKWPVPVDPPDAGSQTIVGFNIEWLPVIIGKLQELRNPSQWIDPPDDITGQVDELITLIQTPLD